MVLMSALQPTDFILSVELPSIPKTPPKLCLLERDVTLAMVYGQACVIVLRHQPARVDRGPGAEVLIYTMEKFVHFHAPLLFIIC
jgi:hypothetical protein